MWRPDIWQVFGLVSLRISLDTYLLIVASQVRCFSTRLSKNMWAQCFVDDVRSHIPQRGCSGFTPDSLLRRSSTRGANQTRCRS